MTPSELLSLRTRQKVMPKHAAVSFIDLLDMTTFNREVIEMNPIPSFLNGNMRSGNAIHSMASKLFRDMNISSPKLKHRLRYARYVSKP